MLTIQLITMGKAADKNLLAAAAEYEKRLSAFCRFSVVELPEEKLQEEKASPALIERALAKEGERILAATKGSVLVALTIEGQPLTSNALAEKLQRHAGAGDSRIAFVIGSSHGLAPAVKQAAAWQLSLSALTFPHELARLVLTEQIYRAFQILSGGKYHK